MYNISEQLFIAVTGTNTRGIYDVYYKPRIRFKTFFFQCKEWAYTNNFTIFSGIGEDCNFAKSYIATVGNKTFSSDSELQVVFDACEYILYKLKES